MNEETTIVVRENQSFDVFAREVEQMTNVCKQLLATKQYTNLGADGIFAVLQAAKALKLEPFQCLNGGLYYVKGKVGMSSEMMASLIRNAGHSITKDPSSNNEKCILYGKRRDTGDEWTSTFTMADATKADLNRNMYHKYPAIMLYNRAMSALARQFFPDVINGFGYTKEELEEIANKDVRKPDITLEENVKKPNKVTAELEAELQAMLLTQPDLKEKVDKYMESRNLIELGQIEYDHFTKFYNRAKKGVVNAAENA